MHYDADYAPFAKAWIATPEDDRVVAIEQHHLDLDDALHDEGRPLHLHVRMHLMVENQAAQGHDAVGRNLARLTAEGVRRHAAVHMIMEVVSEVFVAMAMNNHEWDEAAYADKLDALDAGAWIGARMRRDLGPVDLG
jgi:hypothetical protein